VYCRQSDGRVVETIYDDQKAVLEFSDLGLTLSFEELYVT